MFPFCAFNQIFHSRLQCLYIINVGFHKVNIAFHVKTRLSIFNLLHNFGNLFKDLAAFRLFSKAELRKRHPAF